METSYHFTIRTAGKHIGIRSRFRRVYHQCREYLAEEAAPDFTVWAEDGEIRTAMESAAEQGVNSQGALSEQAGENGASVQADQAESMVICGKIAKRLLAENYLLIHGAAVATDGEAVLITARSGVGKTTRANLWTEEIPGSFILNGDKPLIRITEKEAVVYGTPWCGKEGKSRNTEARLRAVLLLERCGKDSVEEISLGKAFPELLVQTRTDRDEGADRTRIRLLQELQGKARFYRFRSTPTRAAVRLAYEKVFCGISQREGPGGSCTI